jgi:hypothetical protein
MILIAEKLDEKKFTVVAMDVLDLMEKTQKHEVGFERFRATLTEIARKHSVSRIQVLDVLACLTEMEIESIIGGED